MWPMGMQPSQPGPPSANPEADCQGDGLPSPFSAGPWPALEFLHFE